MSRIIEREINRIYIRGDVHGNFDWLNSFCDKESTNANDVMILAGDSGILFFGANNTREKLIKGICGKAPLTFLVVRGNHDGRPENEGMILRYNDLVKGNCYWEDEYPNILYAGDGECYFMKYRNFLTLGGAYSVDKFYRLQRHWTWHPDEELTDEEMATILFNCLGNEYEYIISHTAPLEMEPTWLFMRGIDQSTVSKRMEKFLQRVKNGTNYSCWIWGHYHDDHAWRRIEEDTPLGVDDPLHLMLYQEGVLLEDADGTSLLETGKPHYLKFEDY